MFLEYGYKKKNKECKNNTFWVNTLSIQNKLFWIDHLGKITSMDHLGKPAWVNSTASNLRTCLALYQVTDHKINLKKEEEKKKWKRKKREVGDSVGQKERVRKRHGYETIDGSFECWRRWNANSSKGQVFFHHWARGAACPFRLPSPPLLSWSRVFAALTPSLSSMHSAAPV